MQACVANTSTIASRSRACLGDKCEGHVVAEVLQVDGGLLWQLHGVHLAPADHVVLGDASLCGLCGGVQHPGVQRWGGGKRSTVSTHHCDFGLCWVKGGGPCKDIGLNHARILWRVTQLHIFPGLMARVP